MDFSALKAELTNDPLSRGYAVMTDVEAAASLNTKNRQVDPATVPTALILTGMVAAEWAALSADQKQYLGYVFSQDSIDIRNGSQVRATLLSMFDAQSATRAKIVALLTNLVSRAEEIGGGGDVVRPGDIAMARAS